MTVKITNNGFSTLASGINNSVTTIALASGEGARFPTLTTGNYFYGTLIDTSNNLEIVKVTARSTDSLTVVRAQDNTSARAFSTGDRFELRPVAKLFEDIQTEARDLNGAELVLDADGNTSLREVADNKINFKVGGTDKIQFDDNGRLLFEHLQSANIGGAECKLQIQGTSTETSSISLKSNANSSAAPTLRFGKSRGTSVNSETVVQNNDELGVIVFAGADGSDTQSQGAVIIAAVDGTPGGNDLPTRLVFQTTSDGASGTTERMRLDSNGQLLLGSTSQDLGERLHVAHTGGGVVCVMRTVNSGGTVQIGFKNANGFVGEIVTNGSNTSYATSSDYRLKENVTYTFDATSRLKQLKPARFNFKADADTTLDGFLAHEVSSIVPEAVIGEKDGEKMQSIDQSKLVPLLVKTIQELEARITTLESE